MATKTINIQAKLSTVTDNGISVQTDGLYTKKSGVVQARPQGVTRYTVGDTFVDTINPIHHTSVSGQKVGTVVDFSGLGVGDTTEEITLSVTNTTARNAIAQFFLHWPPIRTVVAPSTAITRIAYEFSENGGAWEVDSYVGGNNSGSINQTTDYPTHFRVQGFNNNTPLTGVHTMKIRCRIEEVGGLTAISSGAGRIVSLGTTK